MYVAKLLLQQSSFLRKITYLPWTVRIQCIPFNFAFFINNKKID